MDIVSDVNRNRLEQLRRLVAQYLSRVWDQLGNVQVFLGRG